MAALIPSASATGSGTMTLAGPSTNSNQTITIPDATGTMMVSGNMPAFSAYLSSNQSVSNTTGTTLAANTEEWDTGGCYNNTGSTVTLNGLSVPAYCFCPNVAGYYQFNASIQPGYSSLSRFGIFFSKNGTSSKRTNDLNSSVNNLGGSCVFYLNGTGDYVYIYGYINASGTLTFNGGSDTSYFQGYMVRSA
jgi:hypothetical protein